MTDGANAVQLLILIGGITLVPALLFTVRSTGLREHSGQIAFPGGKMHTDEPSPLDTAGAIRFAADFSGIRMSSGTFFLSLARFPRGWVTFDGMKVCGGEVWFGGATFDGALAGGQLASPRLDALARRATPQDAARCPALRRRSVAARGRRRRRSVWSRVPEGARSRRSASRLCRPTIEGLCLPTGPSAIPGATRRERSSRRRPATFA